MIKHRIKMESFIHKDNKVKKTYNNNSIKTVQCIYSSTPMLFKHITRSLTIRTTIPIVTRYKTILPCNFTRSHTLMASTRKLHWYTYTLMACNIYSTRWWCWKFNFLPNGQTLKAASATGKYCTIYDANKSHRTRAQVVIDLADTKSEDLDYY